MKKILIFIALLFAANVFAQGSGAVAGLKPADWNVFLANTFTTLGTITSGTWNAAAVGVPYGGTGLATLTAHGVIIGEGASNVAITAAGSTGQWFKSQGASADPVWSTATLAEPSTSGNILISDGTNWTAGTAIKQSTSNTNTVVDIVTLTQNSSGSAAANFGTGLLLNGQSSTTADRNIAEIQGTWNVATDAGRIGQIVFRAANSTALGTIATMTPSIFNLPSGSTYQINATNVLTNNTLGSGVTASSLTSVGTLTGGATGAGFTVALTTSTITGTLTVTNGGTGVTTMTTAYAPICAGTTATGAVQVASTGLSTAGFVLTSNGASSVPSFQAASGGGYTYSTITADQTAAVNNLYYTNKASRCVVTLPASATIGQRIGLQGDPTTANGWKLAQPATTIVYWAGQHSTAGTGGYWQSNTGQDRVEVEFQKNDGTNNIWYIFVGQGQITPN